MSDNRTYYFFFGADGRIPRWQSVFVRHRPKMFWHVGVLMQAGCDVIRVDSNSEGVNIDKYFDELVPGGYVSVEDVAVSFAEKGMLVVKFEVTAGSKKSIMHISNLIPTCVTVVKTVIGRPSWEITPYQLYKGLLRDGGIEITKRG